jgi:hypothetical protein
MTDADGELRRLQQLHEKSLRAAQRQEDSRRKRLHAREVDWNVRQELNNHLETKQQTAVEAETRQKLKLKQQIAARNTEKIRRAEEAAALRQRIEDQRCALACVRECRRVRVCGCVVCGCVCARLRS